MIFYAICFHETVNDKWCLHKSVRQTQNGLERGFAKHGLNSVQITDPQYLTPVTLSLAHGVSTTVLVIIGNTDFIFFPQSLELC